MLQFVLLDLSVDSMFIDFFFNFSPDIIYAYPFVFLNPLELKATPAKERIVFLFILIQLIINKPKTCQSLCTVLQDMHIDYRVITLIFEQGPLIFE